MEKGKIRIAAVVERKHCRLGFKSQFTRRSAWSEQVSSPADPQNQFNKTLSRVSYATAATLMTRVKYAEELGIQPLGCGEHTLATNTFTNLNFVLMGLKNKVSRQDELLKSTPPYYFQNITESEAVGKENDRKFKLLFCTSVGRTPLFQRRKKSKCDYEACSEPVCDASVLSRRSARQTRPVFHLAAPVADGSTVFTSLMGFYLCERISRQQPSVGKLTTGGHNVTA